MIVDVFNSFVKYELYSAKNSAIMPLDWDLYISFAYQISHWWIAKKFLTKILQNLKITWLILQKILQLTFKEETKF